MTMNNIEFNRPNTLADGWELYPLCTKGNVFTSNSYILSSEQAIYVIDPGGIQERAEEIEKILLQLWSEKERPTAVLLTHAHWDHVYAMTFFSQSLREKLTIILSAISAEILSVPDNNYSNGAMFGSSMPIIKPDLLLLSEKTGQANGFSVVRNGFYDEIWVAGVKQLSLRWTPGHSPDGVFYFHENLAFIGDLMYSLTPGVAGLVGWNAKALQHSTSFLLQLSEEHELLYCGGHSKIVSSIDASPALHKLIKDVEQYKNIETITCDQKPQLLASVKLMIREQERLLEILVNNTDFLQEILPNQNGDWIDSLNERYQILEDFRNDIQNYDWAVTPNMVLGTIFFKTVSKLRALAKQYNLRLDNYIPRCCMTMISDFSNEIANLPVDETPEEHPFMATIRSITEKYQNIQLVTLKNDFPAKICWEHFSLALINILEYQKSKPAPLQHLTLLNTGFILELTEDSKQEFQAGLSCKFLLSIGASVAFDEQNRLYVILNKLTHETT